MSADKVERKLDQARQKLLNARERRIKPARDEKILTDRNRLMLATFAKAARALKRDDYRHIAIRNKKLAIVGDNAQPLLDVVFQGYRPNQVVAYGRAEQVESVISLLEERVAEDGKVTAYVCQKLACLMPVTEAGALPAELSG